VKVGDLVRIRPTTTSLPGPLGVVIKIAKPPQEDLDDLFPYLVHFFDGDADFFGDRHLELVSAAR
jgi:hypothetical protein|tara:strand:- start:1097 stop:1291 length:195 start_codon:yes stop_codon:yes gene_type:complete